VPGLAPAYRGARAAWQLVRDAATDTWWRGRVLFPLGGRPAQAVANVWGENAATRFSRPIRDWIESEAIIWSYVFPQFGGLDWYQYLVRKHCPSPRPSGLSLCCGSGFVERDFIKYGICHTVEGVDVSPAAIEVCRRAAEEAGLSHRLSYRVDDVERLQLDPGRYDLVVAWMALHHLRRLEHVLGQVRQALRPGGIFVVNEYVGPARFQLSRHHTALINELLQEIPEELRMTYAGAVKRDFKPPRLRDIVRYDPSEAVCSHHILGLLRRHFLLTDCIEYGGAILYWLLQDVVHNFDLQNPAHRALLERLYTAERSLLASGELKTAFAFVVAQPPEQARS
jgi:SAM-dependent methyltransferase